MKDNFLDLTEEEISDLDDEDFCKWLLLHSREIYADLNILVSRAAQTTAVMDAFRILSEMLHQHYRVTYQRREVIIKNKEKTEDNKKVIYNF